MKHPLFLFIIVFFCSCRQQSGQKTIALEKIASFPDSAGEKQISKGIETNRRTPDKDFLSWKKHEDSLRSNILKNKENNIIKESFLQEMYIRNVVSVSKDSLFFLIPFDLHANDRIAPDCYQTDVSFSFRLGDSLKFPEELQFRENEHGCVKNETTIVGLFQLKEQSKDRIIYHSGKYKRTLVLFRSNKESGAYAFYFTKVGPDKINGKNVYKIMKDFNEEDKNSIYPYTSWILSTAEYENFVH